MRLKGQWRRFCALLIVLGLPSWASAACNTVALNVLPLELGQVVQYNGALLPSIPYDTSSSACVLVRLSTVAIQMSTTNIYGLKGQLVVPGIPGDPCSDQSVAQAVRQALRSYDLLISDLATINTVTCCAGNDCSTLQTDLSVQQGPTFTTSADDGWLVVTGYKYQYDRPDIWDTQLESSQQADPTACRQRCAAVLGCVSFLFTPADSMCQLYLDQAGKTQLGVVQYLQPCGDASCAYGYRYPGSCGASASAGIRYIGQVWEGWTPTINASWPVNAANPNWTMWDVPIPTSMQGKIAPTVTECNCRCTSNSKCVGYVYLGDSKQCWLLDWVEPWNAIVPAADPNTITGRVVLPAGTRWQTCPSNLIGVGNQTQIRQRDSTRIAPVPIQQLNISSCLVLCGNNPSCAVSVLFDVEPDAGTGTCIMFSNTRNGTVFNSTTGTTKSIPLQRCAWNSTNKDRYAADSAAAVGIDWIPLSLSSLPDDLSPWPLATATVPKLAATLNRTAAASSCLSACDNSPGCAMWLLNHSNNSCLLATAVRAGLAQGGVSDMTRALQRCAGDPTSCTGGIRAPGSCGIIASSGLVATGKRLRDWVPEQPGAAAYTSDPQGVWVASASECACRCSASADCMSYAFMGNNRTCYLFNAVDFGVGLEPDGHSGTVLGRLQLPATKTPNCPTTGYQQSNPPTTLSGVAIRHTNPFPVSFVNAPQECNAACLEEPLCVAFLISRAAGTTCLLLAYDPNGRGRLPDGSFTYVQRCDTLDAPPLPPQPPSPPPPPPSIPSSPLAVVTPPTDNTGVPRGVTGPSTGATSNDSGSSSSKTGIVIGVVVGVVVLLAALALLALLLIRKKKRKDKGPYGAGLLPPVTGKSHQAYTLYDATNTSNLPSWVLMLQNMLPSLRWSTSRPTDYCIEEGINSIPVDGKSSNRAGPATPGSKTGDDVITGPDPQQLTLADVCNEIEILSDGLIGEGGSALVFKCRWPSQFGPDGVLACKLMRQTYHGQAKDYVLQSFIYEANVLQRCRHPNVVRAYGYCFEAPMVLIIMELLSFSLKERLYDLITSPTTITNSATATASPGTTTINTNTQSPTNNSTQLTNTTQTNTTGSSVSGVSQASAPSMYANRFTFSTEGYGPLTVKEVLQISIDIAAGLKHLHAKSVERSASMATTLQSMPSETGSVDSGASDDNPALGRVVHRDLKPANILLNSHGHAKVTDFGLARETATTQIHTEHGGAGTLRYMAPEVIEGKGARSLTDRVDIYSFALIMWECVSRERPFQSVSELHLPVLVLSGQRPDTAGYDAHAAGLPVVHEDQALDDDDVTNATAVTVSMLTSETMSSVASFTLIPAFAALIHECWAAEPRSRPSAAEVLQRLERIMASADDS